MRILKIARRPEAYWRELYAGNPAAADLPFDRQFEWFCSDFFGPVDVWQTHLRAAGHEAVDLICGVEPLDAAWRAEFGSDESGFDLILRQVRHYEPEALALEAIQSFSTAEIHALREAAPRLRALIGNTGFDLRGRPELAAVDAVLTCMPNQVEYIRDNGGRAVYFPWWFDRRVLDRMARDRRIEHELSFIGAIEPGPHMHDDRILLLRRVASATDLTIFSNTERRFWPLFSRYAMTRAAWEATRLARFIGFDPARIGGPLGKAAYWTQAPRLLYEPALHRRMRPSFFGVRMYELLRSSRTSLNMHGTLADRYAANMRMFEVTGAGVCLLTDWKENLVDFFADDEVVSYRNIDEASEKAKWLHDHPSEANAIAARGQRRALADHGFDKRVPMVEEAIRMAMS